jgi:hypothetical protein
MDLEGDSFILGFLGSRGDFGEELGGTDLAVRIYCAHRG